MGEGCETGRRWTRGGAGLRTRPEKLKIDIVPMGGGVARQAGGGIARGAAFWNGRQRRLARQAQRYEAGGGIARQVAG